jgi:spore germination cell wall hydrolase CwlJ-like protein
MKGKGFPIVTAMLMLLVFGVVVIILSAKAGAAFEIRSWGQNDTRIEDMSRDRHYEEKQGKYSGIVMTNEEYELLAKIVYLESRGECVEGQQAVVEVIFNRVLDPRFPDSVGEVIYAPGQFCTVPMLDSAYPNEAQYAAIEAAIESEGIVGDAIYFATRPLTKNCVREIGCHYFCK